MKNGAILLAAATVNLRALRADDGQRSPLKIGLVTDLHYADKPTVGTRHYRQSLRKLAHVAQHFADDAPDFFVELGDLVDAADSVDQEKAFLKTVNREFASICAERHYVLGNHCVATLTKNEFLGGIERTESYYSFDRNGFHFVVLDACFRSDGVPYGRNNFQWSDANIPPIEIEWLTADLASTSLPVIVLAHQRLDVSNDYGVKNAPAIRRLLTASGKVLAVLQGHSHANDYSSIDGIHYCTLRAMVEGSGVENNGYSLLQIGGDGTIRVSGFGRQSSYDWS